MARNVVFFAPIPDEATMRFVRAVAKLDDVKLLGVVFRPPEGDDARLYDDLAHVGNPSSEPDLLDAIEQLRRRHGEPHRIIGTVEQTMVMLAKARERYGVPGTSVRTATLFREKAQMKDVMRAAGLPVARHRLVHSLKEASAFVDEVGFPLILKPPAGVGAKDTFRVATIEALSAALGGAGPAHPVLIEELLQGTEHSFETVTIGGEPRVWSISNYVPGCLEVLEKPWIQWTCVLPLEVESPVHERAKQLGFAAVRALGLEDGMTHMEWFSRPDGSLAIGEIAARPPGPQLCQMTGLVHDVDPYRAWARAVIDGALDAPWNRRWAAGCAYVRGVGQGKVAGITGVKATHEAIHPWMVEALLPPIGKTKNDSYEGDGYVVVRHQSTQRVHELLAAIVQTLKIRYA